MPLGFLLDRIMTFRKNIYMFLVAAAGVLPAGANVLGIEGGDATLTGIYIKDLAADTVMVDVNSAIAMCPASVTKSLTTATALSMLGPEHRFTTTVGFEGGVSGTSARGNLVIVASGDPTIGSVYLAEAQHFADSIVEHVSRMGLRAINGSLVVRGDMTDQGPIAQWEIEDVAWPYGAGLYAFNYAGNTVAVYPATGKTSPRSDLQVHTTQSNGGTDLLRGVGSTSLDISTTEANMHNHDWHVETSVPHPAKVFANVLSDRLHKAGISIGDHPLKVVDTAPLDTVYVHRSPRLADICTSLMKRSDNLFAEGVLRLLAPGGSREDCLATERDYWKAAGIDPQYTSVNDGSGLTRSNRLSPRFVGDMLQHMARSEQAETYVSFFPRAGVDGTLKSLLASTPLQGRLAMKTGSMSGVQCYAGYKLDADGKPSHVVVMMVNGFFCSRAHLRNQVESYLLNIFQ